MSTCVYITSRGTRTPYGDYIIHYCTHRKCYCQYSTHFWYRSHDREITWPGITWLEITWQTHARDHMTGVKGDHVTDPCESDIYKSSIYIWIHWFNTVNFCPILVVQKVNYMALEHGLAWCSNPLNWSSGFSNKFDRNSTNGVRLAIYIFYYTYLDVLALYIVRLSCITCVLYRAPLFLGPPGPGLDKYRPRRRESRSFPVSSREAR